MDGLTGIVITIAVVEAIMIVVLVVRGRATSTGRTATPVATRSSRDPGPAVCGACGQPMPKET